MHVRLVASSLVLVCAACSAPSLSVQPRFGTSKIDGHIGASSGSTTIGTNSLDDSLGLDKDNSVPGVRVDAQFGSPHLTLAYQKSSYDGDGTLDADITKDSTTITAGTAVRSNLDLGLYGGLVTFDLLPIETVELGIGLGVQVADMSASIESSGQRISVDETVPIPVLAARVGVDVWRLHFEALGSGLKVDYNGDDATFYDLDLSGRFRIVGGDHLRGSLVGGWRLAHFDVEYDDGGDHIDASLRQSGPYIGLEIGF